MSTSGETIIHPINFKFMCILRFFQVYVYTLYDQQFKNKNCHSISVQYNWIVNGYWFK